MVTGTCPHTLVQTHGLHSAESDPKVNRGRWGTMTRPCGHSDRPRRTLCGGADDGPGCVHGGQDAGGDALSLKFALNFRLTYKIKSARGGKKLPGRGWMSLCEPVCVNRVPGISHGSQVQRPLEAWRGK